MLSSGPGTTSDANLEIPVHACLGLNVRNEGMQPGLFCWGLWGRMRSMGWGRRGDTAPRCSPGRLSAGSGGTCPTDATHTSTRWPRSGERLSSSRVSTRRRWCLHRGDSAALQCVGQAGGARRTNWLRVCRLWVPQTQGGLSYGADPFWLKSKGSDL